jgi:hypothetical protein
MAGNLMDLVRELKGLNARRKAGETLTPAEEARRRELKSYLRSTLEAQGGASSVEESAIKEHPSRSSSGPREPQPRAPARPAAPAPTAAATPAVAPGSAARAAPMAVFDEALPPPPRPGAGSTVPPLSGGRPAPIGPLDGPLDEDVPPPTRRAPAAGAAPARGAPPGSPAPRPAVAAAAVPLDEDLPRPGGAPKPFAPRKDFFAIDAGNLIDEAASSDAVSKIDPWADRKAHASRAEVEEAEKRAEAAIRVNKRGRATSPEEAAAQLRETDVTYTPPEDPIVLEQYYGEFSAEGFVPIEAREAGGLKPIDPREVELAKLDMTSQPGAGATNATVPPGLAFLDDFPVLYAKRVVPSPDEEVVIDSNDPNLLIPGKRKVTVHLLNGEKKQGSIRSLRRGELGFKLEPLGAGQTEEVSISQVKAVFIHLHANQSPSGAAGRPVTATFRDGRSVQGTSEDYQPGSPVFTVVPPAGRGQFERIIVNAAAVQSVR